MTARIRMKKKLLSGIIAAGLFLLTGCASENVPKVEEPEVLQLWYYWDQSDARQCLTNLIHEFNQQHDGIEIKATYIPDEDFKKRLVLAAMEGSMPDLAIVDSSDIQYYDKVGILSDLSGEMNAKDYFARAVTSCRAKDGRLVGLPLGMNCLMFYYNNDILETAGVQPPTTLEEFAQVAEAVTTEQVSGCAFPALQSEESSFCFLPILWNYGGSLARIDTSEGQAAFGFLKDLAKKDILTEDNVSMTLSDIAWEFGNENIAMAFMTTGYETELRKNYPDLHFTVTKLPCGEEPITISGGEVLTVMKNEHQDAAKEFVRFLDKPEHAVEFLDEMGYLAARRDLLIKQVQDDPEKKLYWECLKQAKMRETEAYWPSLSMELAQTINHVILGEDTPDELTKLSEKLDRIRRENYEKE